MSKLMLAMKQGAAELTLSDGRAEVAMSLEGRDCWGVAHDPARPEVRYVATLGDGLWKSTDAGRSWNRVGDGIEHDMVWSVAVSPVERAGREGVVYAGTEPAKLWRSEDGGATWVDRPELRRLPSVPTWRFPPKPRTNHVRVILLDPHREGRILLGIEQGGIMRSLDAGETWEDRKPDGKGDAHSMATHPAAPDRIYVAAGDGYGESRDGGATWDAQEDGLGHPYLMGLALDAADPETMVVTASENWFKAHFPPEPSSTVYRRSAGGPWQEVRDGLPDPRGKHIGKVVGDPTTPGVFYFSTQDADLYRSTDGGASWQRIEVVWPAGLDEPENHIIDPLPDA